MTYQYIPEYELIGRIRKVRLLGFDRPAIYRDAEISIKTVNPRDVCPCQNYVLNSNVRRIMDVRDALFLRAVSVFGLTRGLLLWEKERDKLDGKPGIPFLPPVVEESHEPDGSIVNLINDGMHRMAAAMGMGYDRINVIMIRNVPREYPYYAYPITGGWDSVQRIDELTPGFQKKRYRQEDYKALFRDFNEQFPGVQERR